MTSLVRDLKIAVRHLLKSPGFMATSILMLALGIGATTAIFSIVEGVLLRPLPFPDSGRLMILGDVIEGVDIGGNGEAGVTGQEIRNYIRDTHGFTSLGGFRATPYELSGVGEPANVPSARLSGGVLPALGVQPLMGRVFTQQEDDDKTAVTVLSYTSWQTRFHGDSGVLGKTILLDRKPYVIIGVMPRGFEFPLNPGRLNRTELWVPMSLAPEELTESAAASWGYGMVGRLKPDFTPAQAASDAAVVEAATMRGWPAYMAGFAVHPVVRPLHEETVEAARPLVKTLFLAVTVVLLIACANLAGLLLVRAIRRKREMAVRLALGARAATLLRQAMLESLVLSVSGGVLGLLLAATALRIGVSILPETLPLVSNIGLDWTVVGFALLLAVVTGLACGLAPAFAAVRTSVNDTLKEGGRSGTSGSGHARLRSALVVAEIAVAMVLLGASGLLLRSFEAMRKVDPGFRPDHTLVAKYDMPQKQYSTQAAVDSFNLELLRRLNALPGVQKVGITTNLPDSGANNSGGFVAEGHDLPKGQLELASQIQVQGLYFQAMGIPLLRGRYLSADDLPGKQLAVVVNKKFADTSWPSQDPIGKRVRLGVQAMKTPWMTVIGEVADVKEGSLDKPDKEQYYIAVAQTEEIAGSLASPTDLEGNGGFIALRTTLPPEQMERALTESVRAIDPQLPLAQIQTMEHAIAESEAPRWFNTALISSFAIASLALAVLGIYSVIAFSAALRVPEIAIRMALGSQRSGIVRLVVESGAKLALIGCGLGILGAFAASTLLGAMLFGVSAFDPLVLGAAAVCVFSLSVGATLLPARKAATVDPIQALRSE